VSSPPPVDLLARRSARNRGRAGAEERLLRLHARSPSPETRRAIVHRYLNLARHVARRYAGGQEPWDDLLQVASVALIHAVDRYDPDRNASFASFAVPTIQGELRRHFRDRCWTVRPTRSMLELAPRAEAARESLATALGRTPSAVEVARELRLDTDRVRQALEVRRLTTLEPLSAPDDDPDPAVLAASAVEDDGYVRAETRATLEPLLRTLSAREQRIVRLRFVEDRTQREIAATIGVSQMHVSRLLATALERLSKLADAA
jgi:RNA polymerase sigma-B factor